MKKYYSAILPGLLSVALFGITVFVLILPYTEKNMMEKKKEGLRDLTSMAWNLLSEYRVQEERGEFSGEEARRRAKYRLQSLRYGENNKNYYFIMDLSHTILMHPDQPGMTGRTFADLPDFPNKKMLYDLVGVPRDQGEGVVEYYWIVDGDLKRPKPKMAYVKMFQPWGWVIGSSIYLDDVKHEVARMSRFLSGIGLAVFLAVVLLSTYIAWRDYRRDLVKEAAEKALLEANEKYRAVLQASPNPVALYNPEGKTAYVNPAFTRVFGWSPEEVLGRKIDFVPEDQAEVSLKVIKEAYAADGHPVSFVSRRRVKGASRLVEVIISAAIFKDAEGRAAGMVVMHNDITDLKRQEQVLQESRERYRQVVETANEGVWMLDREWRVIFVNDKLAEMLGYSKEEMTTRPVRDFIHPDDRKDHDLRAGERGQAVREEYELRFLSRSGRPVWTLVSSSPLHDGQGLHYGSFGMLTDITLRKKAEEELKKSEGLFRAVFDQSFHLVGIMSVEGVLIKGNSVALSMVGLPEDAVLGKYFWDTPWWTHSEDLRERLKRAVRDAARGEFVQFEATHLDASGSLRYIDFSIKPVKDESGAVSILVPEGRDITERVLAARELRAKEAMFRALAEYSLDIIMRLDSQGRCLYANPTAERQIGIGRGDFLVKTPRAPGFVPDWADCLQASASLVFSAGRSDRLEVPLTNGRWYDWLLAPELDQEGVVNAVIISARDIGGRKEAERERRKLEDQLRQVKKMEAVGSLAGGVAHDFNNILGAIIGYAEMALAAQGEGRHTRRELLEILDACERARSLVLRILTFSRKTPLEPKPIDLNEVVRTTLALLEPTLPKMIEIESRLAPDLLAILADPNQIEQVVINLAANARDAMPEGGKLRIETCNKTLDDDSIRSHPNLSPGEYVFLRMSDTGSGMDEETKEHIFEPFFSTKPMGQGTGLGLSIVYGILGAHGGAISCYSEPGRGTVFNILLPARAGVMVERTKASSDSLVDLHGRETILFVDDERSLREVGAEILTGAGYIVLTAADGEDALKIFEARLNEIDLVVMDMTMPGMGGRRCLVEMLALSPEAKVLMVSGYPDEARVREILAAGAKGFVAKPYRQSDMLRHVRLTLDDGAVPGPADTA
ncbi:MAG: PAS domain S-box protein [Pseudomonadota bacterium]